MFTKHNKGHLNRFARMSKRLKERLSQPVEIVDDTLAVILTNAVWEASPGETVEKEDQKGIRQSWRFSAPLSDWERDTEKLF